MRPDSCVQLDTAFLQVTLLLQVGLMIQNKMIVFFLCPEVDHELNTIQKYYFYTVYNTNKCGRISI